MNNNNKKMTVIKKKEKALKAAGMKTAAGNGTKGGKAKSQQRSAARSGEGCGADRAEGEGGRRGSARSPTPKGPPRTLLPPPLPVGKRLGGESPPPAPGTRTPKPSPPTPNGAPRAAPLRPAAPHSPTPLPPPLSERRTNFRAARSGAGGARGGAVPAELRGVRSPPSPHLPAAMGRGGGSCVAPRSALTHLSAPSAGPRRACGRTASTSTSSPPPLLLFLPTEENFDGAAAPGLLTALGAERHGGPRGTGTAAAPGAPRRLLGWAGRRRAGAVRSAGSPGPGRGRTRRAQLRGSARRGGGGGGGGAGAAARGGRRPPYHSSSKAGAAAFPARPPTPPRKRREEGGSAPARRFVRGKRRPHPRAPAVAGRGAAPPTSPFFC